MDRFSLIIIQFRWLIITGVVGLSIFFGYQVNHLHINSDILSTLPDDDPTAQLFDEIGDQFGGNDIGMIVLETEDVFTTQLLTHVKQITDTLKTTSGISTVTSLTNILDIKSSEWGIEIRNLVDPYDLPDEPSELDSLKSYVLSKDMYRGGIVSEDGTATIVLFTLLPDADMQSVAMEVKSKIGSMHLPETLYFGGLPFMLIDVSELILSDMAWLIPIVFIVIGLVLFLSFRSAQGMLLPLLTAGIAVIWTLGIMSLLGYEISIISNITPVVLLAIGSAYTIHVLNSVHFNHKGDNKNALIRALSYTLIPIILASLTTAIGFISFVFGAYLTMIRDFGIITSIGILIALLLSIFFVPAFISIFSKRAIPGSSDQPLRKSSLFNLLLKPVLSALFKYPKNILAIWALLLLLSAGGIFLIKTSVNITDYFEKDNPTRITEDILQLKFGGSLPTFVLFEGDMQDPQVLKTMIETERFMKQDPNISNAQSVADLVEEMNDAMGEGKRIPDERAKIEQLWFLLEGQEVMSQLVSDDLDKGLIQSKFASIETSEIEAYTKKMEQFVEDHSKEGLHISFTGTPSIYVRLNDSLVKSQYSSLIIAVVMVLFIVALILRSFPMGLYASIPIVASILVLLGFMGYTGIPLDIATVLVGSIALGIGIDYSIHVVSGFNNHLKENGDLGKSIERTLLTTGRAVIINVASVAAGFLILLFSQMVPLRNFGLLIAISMFGSGIGALTLLPAILLLFRKNVTKVIKQ